jgi:hypothetical protein
MVVSYWKNPETGEVVMARDGCTADRYKKLGYVRASPSDIERGPTEGGGDDDSKNGSDDEKKQTEAGLSAARIGLVGTVASAAAYFIFS